MWFISFCLVDEEDDSDMNCLDDSILQKLSIMMNGLVNVGLVDCNSDKDLCRQLKPQSPNLLFTNLKQIGEQQDETFVVGELNHKDIASALLRHLSDLPLFSSETFQVLL